MNAASTTSDYYRALPFADLTGRNSEAMAHSSSTFQYFKRRILPRGLPADILDFGAGNCWLSYRLAELGHVPVAVDIFSDPRDDGLRAARQLSRGPFR